MTALVRQARMVVVMAMVSEPPEGVCESVIGTRCVPAVAQPSNGPPIGQIGQPVVVATAVYLSQ